MLLANATDPEALAGFFRLYGLEPRLRALYEEARNVMDDPAKESFCAYWRWHGYADGEGMKHRLSRLVGPRAGYPEEPTPDTLGIGDLFCPSTHDFRHLSDADRRALRREGGSNRTPGFPKILASQWANDVASAVLYHQFPACRNCSCL